MEGIKKLFKQHSAYILLVALLEAILSTVCTIAFVYSDTLNYSDSLIYNTIGVEKLLESIYSSTWWALILFLLAFITICTITTIVFKRMEFMFMGILGWVEMFILTINLSKPLADLGLCLLLFVPILIINIIAYKNEKRKIEESNKIVNKVKEVVKETKETVKKKTTQKKNTTTKKKASK